MSEWIKYDKNKAPITYQVICTNGKWVEILESGYHKGEHYFRNNVGVVEGITHWMNLPLPPEE